MDKRLQAEIWETQIWLMWLLAFALLHWGGSTAHVLGWIVIVWSIVTFIGIWAKLFSARVDDLKKK